MAEVGSIVAVTVDGAVLDLTKVTELHLRYYREVQHIVASSTPNDHVVLFAAQLFRLDQA